MNPIVVLLFFATLVTGVTVGVRLLVLQRRTGGIPELVIGLAALSTCVAGLVRSWMVGLGPDASPLALGISKTLFALLYSGAPIGMTLGTWKVFRPDDRWAHALAVALVAVLAATIPTVWLSESLQQARSIVMLSAGLVVSIWTASEALLHYQKLRRRMRLGLADAVTSAQFLFWGLAMVANTASRLVTLAIVSTTSVEPLKVTGFMLPAALLGFATLAFLYLAFFPPLVLQDWLGAREARSEA